MNDSHDNKSIHDSVMAKIDAGKIKMKPHWHFVAKGVLLVVGTVLAVLALLYISSFIIFVLNQTGIWFAPGFGARGIGEFLLDLPWVLILLAIVFIVVLQWLVSRYAFSYGRPLLYSAAGIIVIVVAGGLIISATPVHRGLFQQAEDDNLPIFGMMYKQFAAPPQQNFVPGEIIEIISDGYRINTPRNEILKVIVTAQTQFPFGMDLVKGDNIVVIGDRSGDTITAAGIREIDHEILMPRHRNGMMEIEQNN